MREEKPVVVRPSPEEWRTILSRFQRSGQTLREFCPAENLSPSTFWWWRRKLGQSGSNGSVVDTSAFLELT